jgi:hypothetical protein
MPLYNGYSSVQRKEAITIVSGHHMKNRYALIQRGLFPETLPPCFTSEDVKRALRGIVPSVRAKEFHNKRSTDYVRYNGTKHDGSRRYFGTPNPISYFYVADFIAENSVNRRWLLRRLIDQL